MNKINLSLGIALIVSLITTGALVVENVENEARPYEYLDPEINAAMAFTLEVLEGFSEDDYDFKPADEMRTFREQAYHIAYSLEWFNAQLKGEPIAWAPGDEDSLDKEALFEYTSNQFEAFISIINEAEETGAFTRGVLSTLRHNSHHRGQMVAYFRANGIAPPSYR